MNFQEIRQKYPEYNDMSDADFAQGFHKKFYSDMTFDDFASKVGYSVKPSFTDKVVGAGEAALNLGTGLTTGAVAGTIGAAQEFYNKALEGRLPKPAELESKFSEQAEMGTYSPKTELGAEYSNSVGNVMGEALGPLVSVAPQLGIIHELLPKVKPQVLSKFNKSGETPVINDIPPAPTQQAPVRQPVQQTGMPNAEAQVLKEHSARVTQELTRAQAELASIENVIKQTGDASKEMVDLYKETEARVKKLQETSDHLNEIFADPTKASAQQAADLQAVQDQRRNSITQQLRARRQQLRENEETTPRNFRADDNEIAASQGLTSARPQEEAKISPVEVAISNIARAQENPKLAESFLQKVRDKMGEADRNESKLPGGEYNSLYESLRQEEKAYEAIARGEQPDLSWFEGNNAPETVVEAPTKAPNSVTNTTLQVPEDLAAMDRQIGSVDETQTFDVPTNYEVPVGEVPFNERIGNPPELIDYSNVGSLSPKQAVQSYKYQISGLEQKLETINKQIKNYESGNTPSGTVDLGEIYQKRQSLENSIEHFQRSLEKVYRINPEIRVKGMQEGDTAAYKAMESVVLDPPKYDSVQAILNSGEVDLPHHFLNNKNLFDNPEGSKIFFDKNIPSVQQTIMSHFLKKVGLDKEQVFFVFDNNPSSTKGQHELFGNTSVIKMNDKKLASTLKEMNANEKWKNMFGQKMEAAKQTFYNVRVAAHEIGHLLLTKYMKEMSVVSTKAKHEFNQIPLVKKLQEQFDNLKEKPSVVSPMDMSSRTSIIERQKAFHEFFAEQVSKELLYKHTVGAFTKGIYPKKFKALIDASLEYLRKQKVNIDGDNFARQLVSDIISNNETSLKETGKTIFENFELKETEKQVHAGYDLETVDRIIAGNTDWHEGGKMEYNPQAADKFSVKAITKLTTKAFGRTALAQIFKDNPHVAKAYNLIREAERIATNASKKIWFGKESQADFNSKNVFTRFSDVKNGESPYHTVKQIKDSESVRIHDLFKRGFEESLDYHETLAKYGNELTQTERKAFETLSKMFKQQYDGIVDLQKDLNKKHVLQYRKGWYPAERTGEWFVTLDFDGGVTRREHFATKTAAEAFIDKTKRDGFKHITVSEPQRRALTDVLGEQEQRVAIIDATIQMLHDKYKQSGGQIIKDIEAIQNRMSERGGKAGMHHEQRSNLEGYKGSELYLTPEQRGRSFKEAIISSVDSYSGTMRKMYLNTKLKPMLENSSLDATSKTVIQQMYDSTMNRVGNKMDVPDTYLREGIEKVVRSVKESKLAQMLGAEYSGKTAALDSMVGNTLEMLYLYKIMAKGAFILSQPLSSIQALRHMSYDGGLVRPWLSYGKGLAKLTFGDKELKEAMYKSRQTSNTFEPQFIDALHLTENSGPIMTFIKDWVMLRKPAEVADTMSRAISFASMFTHYRDLGHSFEKAVKLAEHGTDATMITYGNRDTAPMFQHAGFTGQMVRPLQTFPTAALGNFIADIKHINPKQLKTLAPIINYGLATVALSGVLGLQFVSEYEAIRKWMEDKNPGSGPPAIADIMMSDEDFDDRVIGDPDAWKQAALLGIPSTVSGVDLTSSLRANETFATTLIGMLTGQKSVLDALPLTSLVGDISSGIYTVAKSDIGKRLGKQDADLSVHDTAEAINKAAPAGAIGYGIKEFAGVNETHVFGKETGMKTGGKEAEATSKRTTTDKIAGYLGTKSTEDRTNLLVNMRKQELVKRRNEQIKQNVNLLAETGKFVYLKKLTDMQVTDDQIQNAVGTAAYKKFVDQRIRFYANKDGNVNEQRAITALKYGDL